MLVFLWEIFIELYIFLDHGCMYNHYARESNGKKNSANSYLSYFTCCCKKEREKEKKADLIFLLCLKTQQTLDKYFHFFICIFLFAALSIITCVCVLKCYVKIGGA